MQGAFLIARKFAIPLLLIGAMLMSLCSCDKREYKTALKLIDQGEYEEAYEILTSLGDYKDARDYLDRFCYVPVRATLESGAADCYVDIILQKNNQPLRFIAYRDDAIRHQLSYAYDAEGKLLQQNDANGTGYNNYVTRYTYDQNGNCSQTALLDANGKTVTLTQNTYDKAGKLMESTLVSYGVEAGRYIYMYDVKGRLTKCIWHAGGMDTVTEYVYDDGGMLIRETTTTPNGSVKSITYVRDEKGAPQRVVFYESGYSDALMTCTLTLDENGNVIRIQTESPYEASLTYEFTYAFVYAPYGLNPGVREQLTQLYDILRNVYVNP